MSRAQVGERSYTEAGSPGADSAGLGLAKPVGGAAGEGAGTTVIGRQHTAVFRRAQNVPNGRWRLDDPHERPDGSGTMRAMLPRLPGWTHTVDGDALLLVPPGGPEWGAVRYRERVRPLVRMAEVVKTMPPPAGLLVRSVSPPESLFTAEGEFAALCEMSAEVMGRPVRRAVGVVLGDDYYASFDGVGLRSEQPSWIVDTVRELVRADRHYLGVRRRRYFFEPPKELQGLERVPLHAYYYPPAYPRDPTLLVLHPALPRTLAPTHDLWQLFQPIDLPPVRSASEVMPATTPRMAGEAWECRYVLPSGAERIRDVIVLSDDLYLYPLSLDSPPPLLERNRQVANRLLQSIQPLPRPAGVPTAPPSRALSFWS